MGFLTNILGVTFSEMNNKIDAFPEQKSISSDKKEVAETFLKYLDMIYKGDSDYPHFNTFMKGSKGIPMMKIWFTKFTKEETLGHYFAIWLKNSTKLCFEPENEKLTDVGITGLCKEVQKLL